MRHILAFALALGLLAGCAVPPASSQDAYAIVANYTVAARSEAAYAARPDADPHTVARLRQLDSQAYAAMAAVRADAQAGRPASIAKVAIAQTALDQYKRALAEIP